MATSAAVVRDPVVAVMRAAPAGAMTPAVTTPCALVIAVSGVMRPASVLNVTVTAASGAPARLLTRAVTVAVPPARPGAAFTRSAAGAERSAGGSVGEVGEWYSHAVDASTRKTTLGQALNSL